MAKGFPPNDDPLSLSAKERVDRICLAFEEAWKSGTRPRVEAYLGDTPEPERSALLEELLLLELDYRCRSGEMPTREDYQTRYGDHPGIVARVFDKLRHADDSPGSESPTESLSREAEEQAETATYAAGETIGRYTVRRRLGQGGFGTVYLASDEELQRPVAVKIPRRERFRSSEDEERFFEEARTAARLNHPAIVPVHDVGRHDDATPFVVMDYIEGSSLEEVLRAERLSPSRLVEIIIEVADAVHHAHRLGIVHRDLKPTNVLLDTEGKPHITDFGLAERWEGLDPKPSFGQSTVAGTAHFIPPEIYAGRGQIGPGVDIYALGVMMYKVLTGRYPFRGNSLAEVEEAVLRGDVPLPKEIDPEVPEPLQRICLKAMEPDPAARYPSARMLANDLRRFLGGQEVLARPTRYDAELRGRLQNHCTEIQAWQEQSLISVPEMDRLMRPYWLMIEADSPWHALSQRFPWETVVLRLGGWLVLLSSLLWPAAYWDELTRLERVLSVGLPTLLLNVAGWLFYRMQSKWNTRVFLGVGALLLPLLVIVVLTEYGWLRYDQGEQFELFGSAAEARGFITPSNFQLTTAAAAFVAYCVFLLRMSRGQLFVIWLGVGVYVLFTGGLLLCGLKWWLLHEDRATTLSSYVLLCLLFRSGSIWWNGRGGRREASWLYVFFPVPLAVLLTLLGWYGSVEWLDVKLDPHEQFANQTINLWWMANGVVYCLAAIRSLRCRTGFVRFWGEFFLILVPVSFLVPANLLFQKGIELVTVGAAPLTIYELTCGLAAVGFVVAGTRISRSTLAVPGLIGLAVFVFRVTNLHFQDYLSWPLGLALGGGLAMLVGVASSLVRERLQRRTGSS